jgi:hypothetical protein
MERPRINDILRQIEANELRELDLSSNAGYLQFFFCFFLRMIPSKDAFRARVISHVYSGNEIEKEGAEALARSLERNSSLTSLDLSCRLCRYGCVPRVCHFSRVFRQ